VPAATTSWGVSANSALRYERTWYNGVDARSHRVGASLRMNRMWDRVSLDVVVPADRLWFNTAFSEYDFTRLGLNLTPRVSVLFQEAHGLDLAIGANAFFFHTFLDEAGGEDPQHVGAGPLVSLQKDFGPAVAGLGVVFQRSWNLNGTEEATGESYIDALQAGLNVGVPVGERFVANASAIYSRTLALPDSMDSEYVTLGLGATWLVSDTWVLDLTARRNVGYSDADNVEVHVGMSWSF
jgi:hypothetical protein